jgi:hypothetical protein
MASSASSAPHAPPYVPPHVAVETSLLELTLPESEVSERVAAVRAAFDARVRALVTQLRETMLRGACVVVLYSERPQRESSGHRQSCPPFPSRRNLLPGSPRAARSQ